MLGCVGEVVSKSTRSLAEQQTLEACVLADDEVRRSITLHLQRAQQA